MPSTKCDFVSSSSGGFRSHTCNINIDIDSIGTRVHPNIYIETQIPLELRVSPRCLGDFNLLSDFS